MSHFRIEFRRHPHRVRRHCVALDTSCIRSLIQSCYRPCCFNHDCRACRCRLSKQGPGTTPSGLGLSSCSQRSPTTTRRAPCRLGKRSTSLCSWKLNFQTATKHKRSDSATYCSAAAVACQETLGHVGIFRIGLG